MLLNNLTQRKLIRYSSPHSFKALFYNFFIIFAETMCQPMQTK